VHGIRARGDVTVAVDWDSCGPRRLELLAGRAGALRLRSPLFAQPYRSGSATKIGETPAPPAEQGRITVNARRGATLVFERVRLCKG
jgi:alpha-L-fucosidase 2